MRLPPVRNPANFDPSATASADDVLQRQGLVREYVLAAIDDDHLHLVLHRTLNAKGGIEYQRLLMLTKAAMINKGRNLVNHWTYFEIELAIPPRVHYWEISEAAFAHVATSMESSFYRTRLDAGTETDQQLYGGLWVPEEVPQMDGFSVIEEDEAWQWLGLVGGRLPHLEHPIGTLRAVDQSVTVTAGSSLVMDAGAVFGKPPYTVSLADSAPIDTPWVTINENRLVIAPTALTVQKSYRVLVIVTDVLGQIARALWTITVT